MLRDLYRRDSAVKRSVDSSNDVESFRGTWVEHHSTYSFLDRIIQILASTLISTSTVESHFSAGKYEKNVNRTALSDVSLEDIPHSKQYRRMCRLNICYNLIKLRQCQKLQCRVAPILCFDKPKLVKSEVIRHMEDFQRPTYSPYDGPESCCLHSRSPADRSANIAARS